MTPKEKAKELFDKMNFSHPEHEKYVAKECALIAVDEILKSFDGFMDSSKHFRHELEIDAERYWQQVKAEIELL